MRSSRSLAAVPALFTSPARAFEQLRANPGWIGAFLLALLLLAAAFAAQLPQTLRYQAQVTRAAMERLGAGDAEIERVVAEIPDAANLDASDLAQQILLPMVLAALPFFVGAFAFHLLARALGAEPAFRATLGVFSLAHLASALGALAKGLLIRASDSIEVTLGPGVLVPGVAFESPLGIFLDLFDVFSLANAALLGIGARVVLGLSPSAARGAAIGFWTLKAVVVFLLRLSQSWFTGDL